MLKAGEKWEIFVVSPTPLSTEDVIQQANKYVKELDAQ